MDNLRARTRRHFFGECGMGLGAAALASLLNGRSYAGSAESNSQAAKPGHFPAKAKSVIFLFMAGGPSQLDLFDEKPKLTELNGQPVPESLIKGERFAFIKGVPRLLGSPHAFQRCGKSGASISRLLPHLGSVADDVTF